MKPIWIFWTRSFWFGVFPAIIAALGFISQLLGPERVGAVAAAIAAIFGWPVDTVEAIIRGLGAASAFVVAYQRGGAGRPYTLDPRARP